MRIVVGYQDTKAGRDSLALGARLARAGEGELVVVLVLADNSRPTLAPPEVGYTRYLEAAAEEWLANAVTWLGEHGYGDLAIRSHLRYAASDAEGLLDAARELEAGLVVVGTARGGLVGRFRVSGVASVLLHAAEVPVALAPKGLRRTAKGGVGVSRVTAALGLRPGATDVLANGITLARELHAPLRLLSLVALDEAGLAENHEAAVTAAHQHVEEVLDQARLTLPADVVAETVVGHGPRFDDAVTRVDWSAQEVLVVGSSRLASEGRLFLGVTAQRMLRELPVPMVVVPRDVADVTSVDRNEDQA